MNPLLLIEALVIDLLKVIGDRFIRGYYLL